TVRPVPTRAPAFFVDSPTWHPKNAVTKRGWSAARLRLKSILPHARHRGNVSKHRPRDRVETPGMSTLPRLAIGSVHAGVDAQPICWALLALWSARGQQVQHFHATASFPRLDGARAATGTSSRHLDSWLMTPESCRETFSHGAAQATMAIVEG